MRANGPTSKRGIWCWAALKESFSGNEAYRTGTINKIVMLKHRKLGIWRGLRTSDILETQET